jgi:L-alanine-DL-glutamate epimerase-like enolase superfamily enzyme
MRIQSLESFPIRLQRDHAAAIGSAGSPAKLRDGAEYGWAATYPCLYSTAIETALVRVRLDNGVDGWGEAQAPVAPEVACTISDLILQPVLVGQAFDPTPEAIAALWDLMYSAMRVRGQTGGFMLDAISGVDLALWDAAGLCRGESASALLNTSRPSVPAYLSGVPGDRWDEAAAWRDSGIRAVKVYYSSTKERLISDVRVALELLGPGAVAVDCLWRLDPDSAVALCRELEFAEPLFLECPFHPEEIDWHIELARHTNIPVAAGESYRTHYEVRRLLESGAIRYLQPDLGRCGLTEGLRLAQLARDCGAGVIPHVSIAEAPQLAAAIHFAGSLEHCPMVEFNPAVVDAANKFIESPIELRNGCYVVPAGPGLGVSFNASAPWMSDRNC